MANRKWYLIFLSLNKLLATLLIIFFSSSFKLCFPFIFFLSFFLHTYVYLHLIVLHKQTMNFIYTCICALHYIEMNLIIYSLARSSMQVKGYEYNNRSKSIREISFHSDLIVCRTVYSRRWLIGSDLCLDLFFEIMKNDANRSMANVQSILFSLRWLNNLHDCLV